MQSLLTCGQSHLTHLPPWQGDGWGARLGPEMHAGSATAGPSGTGALDRGPGEWIARTESAVEAPWWLDGTPSSGRCLHPRDLSSPQRRRDSSVCTLPASERCVFQRSLRRPCNPSPVAPSSVLAWAAVLGCLFTDPCLSHCSLEGLGCVSFALDLSSQAHSSQ